MRCSLILLPDAGELNDSLLVALGQIGFSPSRSVRLFEEPILTEELPRFLEEGDTVLVDPGGRARALLGRIPLAYLASWGNDALYRRDDTSFFLLVTGLQPTWPDLDRFPFPEHREGRFARYLHWFPPQPAALSGRTDPCSLLQWESRPGESWLRLFWEGTASEARQRFDACQTHLHRVFPFSYLQQETLTSAVGGALLERGLRLAVAESCTGGYLSHLLTNTPGASNYFQQGWIVYRTEAKSRLLDIPPAVIEEAGVVSATVAEELARRAREQAGTDLAIGLTGLAGPGGGTAEVPVGTVYLALAGPEGVRSYHLSLEGSREAVKMQAATWALYRLWRWLQRHEWNIQN